MSAATPVFITAADFATDPAVIAARLGRSFQLPSAGVRISAARARPTARPGEACADPSGTAPGRRTARPPKRSRWDVVGRCFHMRCGDARHLWPGWATCDHHRVPWTVVSAMDDRMQCQYKGASIANRALIGNGGVREFALQKMYTRVPKTIREPRVH